MKNYEQYDYIHDTGLRASGGVSILIRKNIPPQDPINKEQLNNLINQLPKPYIDGRFQ